MPDPNPLLHVSALGIYFHGVFISLTFGLPVAIGIMLWKWWRTGDKDYYKAARLMTAVLGVNFALGAITGTLVEFGLVQIWPGVNLAIATFAFAPLALELIAFANEIAFLVLFIVTLGRVRPPVSMAILALYAAFAYFSGVLITAVNSWMQAPWGTGPVAKALYPFMPEYGPTAVDVPKLVAVKLAAVATGQPISLIVEKPGVAKEVGIVLKDPMVAMYSPYALASVFHNILAAILIGMAVATAGWAYRYFKTGDAKYLKIVKPLAGAFAVLFVIQAPIVAHFMGEMVVEYNPTKFALMEGAEKTFTDPILGLIAYGDPNKPIVGFDQFKQACLSHGNKTVGDLAKALGLPSTLQLAGKSIDLSGVASVKLADLCLADVQRAEAYMPLIHTTYYTKVAFAIIGGLAAAVLFFYFYRVPGLSAIATAIAKLFGDERRRVFILALLLVLGTVIPAVAGWAVREIGRKPWTVYGLLYPSELVTPVPYATSPGFLAILYLVVLAVNLGGLYAMYLVATREYKFLELLKKGAGQSP
ncbi:cytochrome ubiquinol oxidase subunit I [Pyrobaculum neutrophilum]|uniref:Cytochrome bd ubiquinol oxidase subunit I n=1 Tax=Pyrobaculum neutrophilum (strain DSM 2338 / JCM 9278 / NBRC 100436 / V24Sta) TaxID=444157 RepID=B1YBE2_PYRNV|nr:cytochrome ubiquinol oxidase subunit I [Pyrobaculum neutrophilum]ACB39273.1 cytochrome bd ubiquinol oxidase subunit I [Pyrobaculum neutrophilum V24Sta]